MLYEFLYNYQYFFHFSIHTRNFNFLTLIIKEGAVWIKKIKWQKVENSFHKSYKLFIINQI